MFKKIWFQVHWFIGITAGTVLMAIGVTGAILSFREEIVDWLNPGIIHVAAQQAPLLTPQQLIERLHDQAPEERVVNMSLYAEPGASVRINFAPPPGVRRGELRLVNPYTGALLPAPVGNAFFELMERFHRWLLLPIEYGKLVAGSLSVCLLILALSGLYLRWPRRALHWRAWLKLDFGLSGRSFLWNLHSVIGTWALVMYVIFTCTGIYWAFDWVKSNVNALAGEVAPPRGPQPQRRPEGGPDGGKNAANGAGMERRARENGAEKSAQSGPHETPMDLTLTWNSFQRTVSDFSQVSLRLPERSNQPIQINYLTTDSPHERARNRMSILPQSGEVKQNERYADKSRGARFIGAIYPLHMGSYFGLPGRIIMTLASLVMPLFGITGWMLYLDRRRKKRAVRAERSLLASSTGSDGKDTVLLAYASQAGQTERLALHTAAALQNAGVAVQVQSLAQLDAERLRHFHRVLFVVSTFGEGEPPDNARRFTQQLTQQQGNTLGHVQFGMLALGDRHYVQFCGFGHTLDHALRNQGAQGLFPLIEVDNNDAAALAKWQQELTVLTAGQALENTTSAPTAPYQQWTLHSRSLLNPGSCGQALYHLEFTAPATADGSMPVWQSGALAEILPRHPADQIALLLERAALDGTTLVHHQGIQRSLADALSRSVLPNPATLNPTTVPQTLVDTLQPLASRRYSIASIAQDGRVHLLVRQVIHEQGLGLASGWLTAHLPLGHALELRLLENRNFSLEDSDAPAIFIGNGSGLAGLRSHLRMRRQQGRQANWLLFGERQRAHDFLYKEEIRAWQQDGTLSHLDLAFSRDQEQRVYVQDQLRRAAPTLKRWIADGAVLYVCGSLNGMAAGVDAALNDILGEAALQDLIAQGRYRRDVY
jgi:sulfite reductase (NADPH) flavoprotein alpha-component